MRLLDRSHAIFPGERLARARLSVAAGACRTAGRARTLLRSNKPDGDQQMKIGSKLARVLATLAGLGCAIASPAAHAAPCGNDAAGFGPWLAAFKGRAAQAGISAGAIAQGLDGVSYDPTVVRLDRSQRSFKLSFEQFYARRVGGALISKGQRLMGQHAGTLAAIEKRFGVPPAVLVSIWGLETNYGADTSGKYSIVRSLATLAYDCRRSAFFENELLAALKIIQRGDMSAAGMRGGWAGEIGQVQFLPSSYVKFAVDFDGDGRRDLVRSVPDMLASTANFLKAHGWKAGQDWGPGTANYAVFREWNRAEVYARTIAVMSGKLAGRG
jgi:lytic murein transglycosylase